MCNNMENEGKKNKSIEETFMNEYNEIENAFGKSFLDKIDVDDEEDV